MIKNTKDQDDPMISASDSSSTEEFDMLDDIYRNQPLFRLMPQTSSNLNNPAQPIVEPGLKENRNYFSFYLFISFESRR